MKISYLLSAIFVSLLFTNVSEQNNYQIIYEQGFQDKNDKYKILKGIQYSLIVNKDESYFERIESMVNDIEGSNERYVYLSGGSGKYYSNNSFTLHETSYKNKIITIKLNSDSNWQITKESKLISGYKCYKAIYTHKRYDEIDKKYSYSKTYAWFTPNIAIPFGPTKYRGLPGLILQIRPYGGKLYFTAKSIKKTNEKITKIQDDNSLSEDEFAKLTSKENSAVRKMIKERLDSKNKKN